MQSCTREVRRQAVKWAALKKVHRHGVFSLTQLQEHPLCRLVQRRGACSRLGPSISRLFVALGVSLLQMQTRDPKIISHTGQVESEATYTIHPDARAMLCDCIARLPSAPKTAVSASKAGRRSRSQEAMGPSTKRRRSEEEPEDVCAALAQGLCKYDPAFKGESLWIYYDGSCRGIFHKTRAA
jgi:hypothetical protein